MSFSMYRFVIVLYTTLGACLGYADFLPPNNLHLEERFSDDGGISEEVFHNVIDRVEELYRPIIEEHGANLIVERRWNDPLVNAMAAQKHDQWYVIMYGGLAKRPEITEDGFAFVVCHEMGHHLGGFPLKARSPWEASSEGQSDYFASHSCGRMMWQDEYERNEQAAREIPDYPKQLCDEVYFAAGQDRLNLCYRQMLASVSVTSLLAHLGNSSVSFADHDHSVVANTYDGHPQGQCRLDTYMAGALCNVPFDDSFIPRTERESVQFTCHQAAGDKNGLRPRCWFRPGLDSLVAPR